MGEVIHIAVHIKLNFSALQLIAVSESESEINCKTRQGLMHKCQEFDFYFLLLSYKLKPQNFITFESMQASPQCKF